MTANVFHSETVFASISVYTLVPVAFALVVALAFQWRDLHRRERLNRANRRLAIDARFIELSKDLAVTTDFERNVISCNHAWEEVAGMTLADLQSEPFGSRIHPDDLELVQAGVSKLVGGAERDVTSTRFRRTDGTWLWLEWHAVASPEDQLIFASARDVTERVKLTEALDLERRQLRSAQEIARIGSWNLEVATGEMYWSETTYQLLGIDPPAGAPDAELWLSALDPAEHDRGLARLADAIKHGGEFTFDFQRARPDVDGEPVFIATKGYAERDPDGRTTRLTGTIVDVTERKRYEERLKFIADHDPLTGLPNRRKFDDVLERHIAECVRYGARGAMMMIDLDHLKRINDDYGHVAGDNMIKCMADGLRERLRDTDIGARIGGDEFAVLLSKTTHEGARLVAHSLIERLMAGSPELRAAGVTKVSASIGIALIADVEDPTPEHVVTAADDAMYAAKRAGTGNVREHHQRGRLSSVA
jgi:diguanylate cyclase (GGDEF)-like protein/PAS domain S-box-containing protein